MPTLPELPEKVLLKITKFLDFQSLVTLRKVCHDLRNFIDDAIPKSSISGISLTVTSGDVVLELDNSRAESRKMSYSQIGQEAVDIFWRDFELLLKHQTSTLTNFTVLLEYPGKIKKLERSILERTHSRFLNRLQEFLLSLKDPLPIENIVLKIENQSQIMKVLPHIDVNALESISIHPVRGREMEILDLSKVIETEQWTKAKELAILDFFVKEPMESFTHFDSCRISVMAVSEGLLRKLKDSLLFSPNLEAFELHHKPVKESEELKTFFENIFDASYPDHFYQDRWYSRISGNDEFALSIRSDYFSWITFSHVNFSEIQQMMENESF